MPIGSRLIPNALSWHKGKSRGHQGKLFAAKLLIRNTGLDAIRAIDGYMAPYFHHVAKGTLRYHEVHQLLGPDEAQFSSQPIEGIIYLYDPTLPGIVYAFLKGP